MKHSIYNGIENLTKKEIINQTATAKKEVRTELANFANSIEFAYKQLTATTSVCRNSANMAKGLYKTALEVVVNCYPYQTASGELCIKTKDGFKVRTLKGRACAGAVVSKSIQNLIDYKVGRKSALVEVVTPIAQ